MDDPPEALREVGDAATWSLSSCKLGFGVPQLRDGLTTTYWQFGTMKSASAHLSCPPRNGSDALSGVEKI